MALDILLAVVSVVFTVLTTLLFYVFDILGFRDWVSDRFFGHNLRRAAKRLNIDLNSMCLLTGLDKIDCCLFTLLLTSTLSMEEIKRRMGFSEGRIVDSLERLKKHGLVQTDERRTGVYSALKGQSLRELIRFNLVSEVRKFSNILNNLPGESVGPVGPVSMTFVQGRENFVVCSIEMFKRSSGEKIFGICSKCSLSDEFLGALVGAITLGSKARLLLPHESASKPEAKKLRQIGVEVRKLKVGNLKLVVVEGKEALLGIEDKDKPPPNYEGYLFQMEDVAQYLGTAFEAMWERGE